MLLKEVSASKGVASYTDSPWAALAKVQFPQTWCQTPTPSHNLFSTIYWLVQTSVLTCENKKRAQKPERFSHQTISCIIFWCSDQLNIHKFAWDKEEEETTWLEKAGVFLIWIWKQFWYDGLYKSRKNRSQCPGRVS